MKRILILAFAVAGASLSLKAQGGAGRGATDAAAANPLAGNAQAIEQGRDIYNRTCTTCHGPDGAGGEMGPALGAPARRYALSTDAQIFDAIKSGISRDVDAGIRQPPAGQRRLEGDGVHPR